MMRLWLTTRADMKIANHKLDLPAWSDTPVPPKRMTMCEYTAFVEYCWKNLPNKKRVLEDRLRDVPTARFVI